jgi:hypothetical protein
MVLNGPCNSSEECIHCHWTGPGTCPGILPMVLNGPRNIYAKVCQWHWMGPAIHLWNSANGIEWAQ